MIPRLRRVQHPGPRDRGCGPGLLRPRCKRGASVLTQVHCHQHAVLGWDADEKLLTAVGAQAEHLETGCCGLAGNFGFQVCYGEVSEACAERALLPRLREAAPGAAARSALIRAGAARGKQRRFIRKALPTVRVVGPPWQPY